MIELERRNAYFCTHCRKVTITVDIDEGVTPMFILCPYCKGTASSFMYQVPGCMHFNIKADLEWYKPNERETLILSKSEAEHVFKGGLLSRKRTNAKPMMTKYGEK
jgi:hypothetical protein